jgi:uracil-DNA glycosylase
MKLTREELGGWYDTVAALAEETWCRSLFERVDGAYGQSNPPVYPPRENLFTALRLTPPERVKCVILGQDPYHERGQAHGLAFSVRPGVALPRSLRNIYRELQEDLGIPPAASGSLIPWAEQGVLLLNNALTVYEGAADSHKNWGWEPFTTALLQALQEQPRPIAFVLWGNNARRKGETAGISDSPYPRLVIASAHPSPLSARRGFFGSRPFSRVNAFLQAQGEEPINWNLEPAADFR